MEFRFVTILMYVLCFFLVIHVPIEKARNNNNTDEHKGIIDQSRGRRKDRCSPKHFPAKNSRKICLQTASEQNSREKSHHRGIYNSRQISETCDNCQDSQ